MTIHHSWTWTANALVLIAAALTFRAARKQRTPWRRETMIVYTALAVLLVVLSVIIESCMAVWG
jgi:hypothetical protein